VFEIYHFSEAEIICFALMLLRISACMVVLPIFGSNLIPPPVKILLSLVTCFVLFPVLKTSAVLPTTSLEVWKDSLILLALREVFVGVFMGFLARFLFIGVEVAGQILSFSLGYSTVQLLNPAFGDSGTMMDEFETLLATLLFLAINGHHIFFEAIYRSFQLAPVGVLSFNVKGLAALTFMSQEVFTVGVKLAGPMIAVILFLNIALGIVGRAVPQINVFVISFPVNILVGLFVFMVSIPLLLTVMDSDFTRMGAEIFQFLKGF